MKPEEIKNYSWKVGEDGKATIVNPLPEPKFWQGNDYKEEYNHYEFLREQNVFTAIDLKPGIYTGSELELVWQSKVFGKWKLGIFDFAERLIFLRPKSSIADAEEPKEPTKGLLAKLWSEQNEEVNHPVETVIEISPELWLKQRSYSNPEISHPQAGDQYVSCVSDALREYLRDCTKMKKDAKSADVAAKDFGYGKRRWQHLNNHTHVNLSLGELEKHSDGDFISGAHWQREQPLTLKQIQGVLEHVSENAQITYKQRRNGTRAAFVDKQSILNMAEDIYNKQFER